MAEEFHRLRRIVEDLLWLARFDSEPSPPGDEPVDLSEVARGCVDHFGAVADARGIRLSVQTEGGTEAGITAPVEWIERLAGVLVDNACRYAGAGGTARIVVTVHGNRAYLVVEDSGPGIPVEERPRLFDRFYRATDESSGSGLGLAIADTVVRSTGGRWHVSESTLGGARMEVSWHRTHSRITSPRARGDQPGASDEARVDKSAHPRSCEDLRPSAPSVSCRRQPGAHPSEDEEPQKYSRHQTGRDRPLA